ncbi:hypothetical protein C8R42DRAFT_638887 [Lentinula raphanica]|nr:hypothetical protein C8R42DRAFT_638887 [Lentinula raphanica]
MSKNQYQKALDRRNTRINTRRVKSVVKEIMGIGIRAIKQDAVEEPRGVYPIKIPQSPKPVGTAILNTGDTVLDYEVFIQDGKKKGSTVNLENHQRACVKKPLKCRAQFTAHCPAPPLLFETPFYFFLYTNMKRVRKNTSSTSNKAVKTKKKITSKNRIEDSSASGA